MVAYETLKLHKLICLHSGTLLLPFSTRYNNLISLSLYTYQGIVTVKYENTNNPTLIQIEFCYDAECYKEDYRISHMNLNILSNADSRRCDYPF